ncbi:MAG: metallophosphoesterase family protein [Ignavibacteria bacterium]
MKYAIISDVHANSEAVTACFKEIERLNVERIICLGDLVDYCAEPNEVVKLIKENCDVVVLGNHDEAQYKYQMVERYTENARISSIHTRSVINPEHVEYFKTLPYSHTENELLFVHASPLDPPAYRYLLNEETAENNFKSFTEKVCFIGHSHKPLIFELSGSDIKLTVEGELHKNNRYIINVGSVGQPRDGNPKLSFGFFDTDSFVYNNIRVDYDIASSSEKVKKEGLPLQLAERLFNGV